MTHPAEREFEVLTTSAGAELLRLVEATVEPRPADLARWRRDHSAETVAAALRLVQARRKGAVKFPDAARMWLDPVGVEQATSDVVARHKAARFAGAGLVLDVCCGIGGDATALARHAPVVAVDADFGMCRRTRWNAEVAGVAAAVRVVRARAERLPILAEAHLHIDPDRRAVGRSRASSVAQYVPGIPTLRDLMSRAAGGAIKFGPASDFEDDPLFRSCEIEWIGFRGECKEATVRFGDLIRCRRRVTHLPDGSAWTDRDASEPETALPIEPARPGLWIFVPEPAMARSGLLDGFARAHGLARAAPGSDVLTSDRPLASPFVRGYEVRDVGAADLKRLKHRVREMGLGPLDIKVRGPDLRPEALRERLDPPGPNPAVLLIFGLGTTYAVIAERPCSPGFAPVK